MYGSHMSLFFKSCKEKCISMRQKEQYLARLSGEDREKMPGMKEITTSGPIMVMKSMNNQESCFNNCNQALARSQDPTKSARSTAQQLARGIFKVRRDQKRSRDAEYCTTSTKIEEGEVVGEMQRTNRERKRGEKSNESEPSVVWCCFTAMRSRACVLIFSDLSLPPSSLFQNFIAAGCRMCHELIANELNPNREYADGKEGAEAEAAAKLCSKKTNLFERHYCTAMTERLKDIFGAMAGSFGARRIQVRAQHDVLSVMSVCVYVL